MGWMRYMAKNHVAANLLMLLLLAGGWFTATKGVKQEVFPEIELDRVIVTVAYPGAAPEEVEQGIVRPIEEAVNGLDGVRRVLGIADESVGSVMVEALESANIDQVLQDVKSAVDRIITFPNEAERPMVRKLTNRHEVIMVVVYGEMDLHQLRQQTERVRDELLGIGGITQVELGGLPNYEIAIEISEEQLRHYGLTLDMVAAKVRSASLDLPGGMVKAKGGEVLLRTTERRNTGREYEEIVIVSKPDGTLVRLKDIAQVEDGFEESNLRARYDGKPAGLVSVYRVGDQGPREIAAKVHEYVAKRRESLPAGIALGTWFDRSEILQQRIDLLARNFGLGLVLVIVVLGLFLDLKLAFWVTMGIPISVLGAFIILPATGVTINMISVFAFILVLGIVVDDAIVVGENIYYRRSVDENFLEAAVRGAAEVGRPVTFSVLTTVAAFAPLLFITGIMGKFMFSVPVIVISVLMVSLIESLFVLPAHLSGGKEGLEPTTSRKPKRGPGPIARIQAVVRRGLDWVIRRPYVFSLKLALKYRYVTLALGIVSMVVTVALFSGGYMKFVFMPEIESDLVRARLVMPYGTSIEDTEQQVQRMLTAAKRVVARYDAKLDPKLGKSIVRNVAAIVGSGLGGGGPMSRGGSTGTHLGEVAVYLVDSGARNVNSTTFAHQWRQEVGEIAGAKELDYTAQMMRIGDPIAIQLAHPDFNVLRHATERLKARLKQYPGLYDIADSFESGKREMRLKVKAGASALGITSSDLARQVRGAFYGAEALRLQRGRNEIKVMVRYPLEERRSLANVDALRIRTAKGGEIPFSQAASVAEGRGFARINRTSQRRTVDVVSKADPKVSNPGEVMREIETEFLPKLLADYPGLTYDLEGEQRERMESVGSIKRGLMVALGLIFALLAIPFRSYAQPLIIMSAIPFGFIGAVIGHVLLGYDISMMSLFGIVALTGVVVNDSLVLVDFVNRSREAGASIAESVLLACVRRFRPIMLTTLTTFFALVPMLTETSMQARFLIPMAISLGFGVLFATAITLVLIPTLYVLLEDAKNLGRWVAGKPRIPIFAEQSESPSLLP